MHRELSADRAARHAALYRAADLLLEAREEFVKERTERFVFHYDRLISEFRRRGTHRPRRQRTESVKTAVVNGRDRLLYRTVLRLAELILWSQAPRVRLEEVDWPELYYANFYSVIAELSRRATYQPRQKERCSGSERSDRGRCGVSPNPG